MADTRPDPLADFTDPVECALDPQGAAAEVRRLRAALSAPSVPAPLDSVVAALKAAFSGDEYQENAEAAAGEGEWSWFRWLAVTTIERFADSTRGSVPAPLDEEAALRLLAHVEGRMPLHDALDTLGAAITEDTSETNAAFALLERHVNATERPCTHKPIRDPLNAERLLCAICAEEVPHD